MTAANAEKKMLFVGIAGGSGAGKTTLAQRLEHLNPDKIALLHLDDFQKFQTDPPKLEGLSNWEHPDYIDWNGFIEILIQLRKGQVVSIEHRDPIDLGSQQIFEVSPKRVVVVEGYLLFYNSVVRNLLDLLIFVDVSEPTRISRRTKMKYPKYVEKVLLPMHQEYVEPTRHFATHILNGETIKSEVSAQIVERWIASKAQSLGLDLKL